jgi:DNA-binding NtrC family response regulator
VALTEYDKFTVEDPPERLLQRRGHPLTGALAVPEELLAIREVERQYIAQVLEATAGSETRTARILGFDRARPRRPGRRG